MTATPAETPSVFDLLAKQLGLLAALVPLVGFIMRFVAFSFTMRNVDAAALAWSASLSQLVFTGASGCSVAAFTLGLSWFLFARAGSFARRWTSEEVRESRSSRSRAWRRAALVSGRLVVVAVIVFMPAFPAGFVVVVVMVALTPFLNRAIEGPPEHWLRNMWPLPVGLAITVAVLLGAVGLVAGVGPSSYVFTPAPSGLPPNGNYQQLASDSGRIYLETCRPAARRVVAVNDAFVVSSTPTPQPIQSSPSLRNILFNGARPRFGVPRC